MMSKKMEFYGEWGGEDPGDMASNRNCKAKQWHIDIRGVA